MASDEIRVGMLPADASDDDIDALVADLLADDAEDDGQPARG